MSEIIRQLKLAGATLPAKPVEGTPESGIQTGLSIALALAENVRDYQDIQIDALKHDIARHVSICAEQANEIAGLRELSTCGCGDSFTTHDPGTCANCLAGMDNAALVDDLRAKLSRADQRAVELSLHLTAARQEILALHALVADLERSETNQKSHIDALESRLLGVYDNLNDPPVSDALAAEMCSRIELQFPDLFNDGEPI